MIEIHNEIEELQQFTKTWQSLGWWAVAEHVRTDFGSDDNEFRARLISPKRVSQMLDSDHAYAMAHWRHLIRNSHSDAAMPERAASPSVLQLYDAAWSVGETARVVCDGAILVAQVLYPREMPAPEQYRQSQPARMSF